QDQTLQTMLEEISLADTPQLKKDAVKGIRHRHHKSAAMTGSCMIHALAFSTLLSSQETDATTITRNPPRSPEIQGDDFRSADSTTIAAPQALRAMRSRPMLLLE
ncbi:hypothetical protein, partial [Microbispora sp. NPDC046933]|uniref:hypothetical protein n=1 Tax=Microbispora sp. NPDC046933 TaxID=3155618 RepID=UPI0033D258FC